MHGSGRDSFGLSVRTVRMDSGILDMKINLDVSQVSQLLSALMLLEGRQVQLTQKQLL